LRKDKRGSEESRFEAERIIVTQTSLVLNPDPSSHNHFTSTTQDDNPSTPVILNKGLSSDKR
jgi:hypothetical protein